ncbi:hydantoinase/oxoprolinase family protein [Chloroflexota bacterium]
MKFYMGIDVGGTFTDGVLVDEEEHVHIFKTPTVPENPSVGFMNCLKKAADSLGLSLATFLQSMEKLTYGTTLATNIVLEGKGAKTGLITTKGFKDTLPIARIGREYLSIDLSQVERFPSLTPRSLIEEVSERVDYAGQVVTPLDMEDVYACVDRLLVKGVEAMAVCFLWSFKNHDHEKMTRDAIFKREPKLYVSISSEVAPISGEYERTATVTINASLGPPMKAHFAELTRELAENQLAAPLLIMQGTGGLIPAEDAHLKPVALLNSGPAGGVIASQYIGELLNLEDTICIDMGGTSFDVSLLLKGQCSASIVSRACNHNVYVPMLDIYSIGTGGGSIAWLDMGTRLKVGPESAGADPGPACYDKGGVEPTVTDADVVLGFIDPEYFLGGQMVIDAEQAKKTIKKNIADPLGMELSGAASSICRIAENNMADAIRVITVQKGYDPRGCAIIAFGGAGPVHAAAIARELGLKTVIIPSVATVQSAFGIVTSDIVHSLSIGDVTDIGETDKINLHYSKLEEDGLQLLRREGIPDDRIEIRHYADMRYKMQSHEVTIPVESKRLAGDDLTRLAERFEEEYESTFGKGTTFRQAGFEIVNFRVEAIGKTIKPTLSYHSPEGKEAISALKMTREVFFDGDFVTTNIYDGGNLKAGNVFAGPAIVEYVGTTAVVYPGQVAQVDPYLNLILREV